VCTPRSPAVCRPRSASVALPRGEDLASRRAREQTPHPARGRSSSANALEKEPCPPLSKTTTHTTASPPRTTSGSQKPLRAAGAAFLAAVALAPAPAATAADTAAAAAAAAAAPAAAPSSDAAVDAAVSTAVEAVRAAGGVAKTGAEVLAAGFRALQQGYEVARPALEQAADLAAPALRQAADLAAPALKQAPAALGDALAAGAKATGVDVDALGGAARGAAGLASAGAAAAAPAAGKVASFLADKDPLTLGGYALAAAAASLVAPALAGALAGGLRGYAGDVTPVQALDLLATDGSAVLVDVRTAREKESAGVPEVASSASGRVVEVEFAATGDRRLRGALRDPAAVELRVTALQVAALRRVRKGSRVILLDRSGGQARAVARELARMGFGRALVVQGGFDGWVRSRLLVKPAAPSPFSSSSSPSSSSSSGQGLLPAALARTVSTRAAPATRKALPAGR